MKTAKFLILIALVAALVAGCGGSSDSASLQSDDVAVVGDTHISKADYDALIAQAKRSFAQQTPPRKFPAQGTPEFQTIRGQAVTLLVQQAEREEKATSEGIKITEKQIDDRLAQIKKQYFQNSEAKYKAQLAKQHLTEDAGAQGHSRPADLGGRLQEGHERRQDRRRRGARLLHRAPAALLEGPDARRAPHPRQVEGAAPTRSTRS